MKNKLLVILIFAIALLSGCRSFPTIACESWHHEGNYGFVTTQYDAKNVVKLSDGSLRVETYSGNVKVAGGYGVTDTITGLVLTPKQAAAQPPVAPNPKP